MRTFFISIIILLTVFVADAQMKGGNTLGDYGVMCGTQPPSGLYTSLFYYNYNTNKVLNANGDKVTFAPSQPGEISFNAIAGVVWWVSDFKILGGTYSSMGTFAFTNAVLEMPVFGLNETTNMAFGDMYFQPINLGWTTKKLDYMAGLGLYVPTGKYEDGADDNAGMGMWGYEMFCGATYYFDEKKSWTLALSAWYETHSEKKDSDTKVGDILSLEGALGKTFSEGSFNVGIAYYAQWKITNDKLNGNTLPITSLGRADKHQLYGIGPEATFTLRIGRNLTALVNVKYFWEMGALSMAEGNTFTLTTTFPFPKKSN